MKFKHPHTLGKAEARRRVEHLVRHWQEKYGVKVIWEGDRASVDGKIKGFDFDARVTISEGAIDAEGSDPGFLVRAVVVSYLRTKLTDYLDPAKVIDEPGRLA